MNIQTTRIDILKMLLYAPGPTQVTNEPIVGRTRLQKEMFLAQKALIDKKISRLYSFMPYYYGPFSRQLYVDLNWLESKGLVEERSFTKDDEGIYREFRLTTNGVMDVEALIAQKDMREIYEIVRGIKQMYNGMPLASLVNYTHRAWPDYVISSTVH